MPATHIELIQGDNDKSKKWGGKILADSPSYLVNSLQEDLKAVGVYNYVVDGDYGQKTNKALKIFQWACANIKASIKNGVRVNRCKKNTIFATGKLDKSSYDELILWVNNKQVVTGDLIRIPFSSFSNIEAGSGFKKIKTNKVMKDEIVISKMALPLLKEINKHAKSKKVTIKINQAFRVSGIGVSGAVVTPAKKSQHLIGHAIDCNIIDGGNWNSSNTFKMNKESKNAKEIIKLLKSSGFRWGGDFSKTDTPHFDKQLISSSFVYDAKFYLNQRTVSKKHTIPKEII